MSLFRSSRAARKSPRRPVRLGLSQLEGRDVPAVTASFGPGILGRGLVIQGTDAKDNIAVVRDGQITTVTSNGAAVPIMTANGVVSAVSTAAVDAVAVNGQGNDDRIDVIN